MSTSNEQGKGGFVMTVIAMVILVLAFATTALNGGSPLLNRIIVIALFAGLSGHFLLGGGEYRSAMIARKRAKRDK